MGLTVQIPEILSTLVEVFIALIGFSGVVVALGPTRLPTSAHGFRIKALIFASSVGLGGSLLPAVLSEFTSNFWPVAMAALGVCMAMNLFWALRNLVPMKADGQVPTVTFWVVTSASIAVIGALAFSTFAPSVLAPAAAYTSAVVWNVYLAMNHFARLILAVSWGQK